MLQQYLNELKKIKLLTPGEEKGLWAAYKEAGDLESRRRLIEHYQPLVFKVALQWRTADESRMMDLIQEGTVGLIEAVEGYDHIRGVAFSLFAFHRIRGRILNFINREGRQNWVYMDSPLADEDNLTLAECIVDEGAEVAVQAEQNFLVEQVKTAMGRLPANEQFVLCGMYLEEREPKQLAESLDMSISHIYRLQKQGIRRVRGMLSRLMQDMKNSF